MNPKMEFFDSNVLIAASMARHVHHAQAIARLAAVPHQQASCAAHSLAETYNTLTRDSAGFLVPTEDAAAILGSFGQRLALVQLDPPEMLLAIQSAANLGLGGPIIYDALLMACARKVDAAVIYTFNVKHFSRVAPTSPPASAPRNQTSIPQNGHTLLPLCASSSNQTLVTIGSVTQLLQS